jgi:hypothetical protein
MVPAGRRSGKTERFKRFLSKIALSNPGEKYFAAAPTHSQAKKIFWQDLKLLTFSPAHARRPSESEQIIYLPNETEIHVFGLDKPERMEGINWTGGGIDEIADVKEAAVNENIMPALDTVDPRRALDSIPAFLSPSIDSLCLLSTWPRATLSTEENSVTPIT